MAPRSQGKTIIGESRPQRGEGKKEGSLYVHCFSSSWLALTFRPPSAAKLHMCHYNQSLSGRKLSACQVFLLCAPNGALLVLQRPNDWFTGHILRHLVREGRNLERLSMPFAERIPSSSSNSRSKYTKKSAIGRRGEKSPCFASPGRGSTYRRGFGRGFGTIPVGFVCARSSSRSAKALSCAHACVRTCFNG